MNQGPQYATDAEVKAAVVALSDDEAHVLRRAAEFRARSLVALGLGVDADDLLKEAIARTIAGTRRWRRGISLVQHLKMTMRSIASHLRDKMNLDLDTPREDGQKRYKLVAATGHEDGDALDSVMSRTPAADAVVAARDELRLIRERFASDQKVLDVIDGLESEMTGPDIQEVLGISDQEYETRIKRMRETLARDRRGP